MPQMSPINWTVLYVMFLILLLMVLIKVFFMNPNNTSPNYEDSISYKAESSIKNNLLWEW